MSSSTTEGIRIALNRGTRCIELDVYRDETNPKNVFVAHGKEELPRDIITTTKLPFEKAIEFIAKNAFVKTSDPLFLALEFNVHNNPESCNTVFSIINTHLAPILFKGSVTPDTKLSELVGKVVLMCGGGVVGPLTDCIHIQWSSDFLNESSELRPLSPRITPNCIRIYPRGDLHGALSLNFDAIPFLNAGATFVALNVCTNDDNMKKYAAYFMESSFRLH